MALSARTYIRERSWTKLIRNLPEGANDMPVKMDYYKTFLALKACCVRENRYESDYNYIPSFNKGVVTITKIRNYGESDK